MDKFLLYGDYARLYSGIKKKREKDPKFLLIDTVEKAEEEDYEPIAAAIAPYGTIRDSFVKGDITVSDVFNVSSLGVVLIRF